MGTDIRYLIVAAGAEGLLFVNSLLARRRPFEPLPGQPWAHVVLDVDGPAYCQLDDLWLWSFDS